MVEKKKITREWLEGLGITDIDSNGQIWKGQFPMKYSKIWARHKYGKDKFYYCINVYDKDYYQEQMIKWKEGKLKQRPTGVKPYLVHRIIWAWFYGETPEHGYDVCHKDDDPTNNSIDNLQVLSHGDNIRNRKIAGSRWTNYYTVNGLVKDND